MIDKNDAPEGYEAVYRPSNAGCKGCAFHDTWISCDNFNCLSEERKDKHDAIFIKKSEPIIFAYGSCGEYLS